MLSFFPLSNCSTYETMKSSILLIAFLYISFGTTWGQRNTWSFDVFFSPEAGYRMDPNFDKLSSHSDYYSSYDGHSYEFREEPTWNYSTGISASYSLSRRISVHLGILYNTTGKRRIKNSSGYYLNYTYKSHANTIYRSHYIGIPLYASFYYIDKEKFRAGLDMGVNFNVFLVQSEITNYSNYRTSSGDVLVDESGSTSDKSVNAKTVPSGYPIFNPQIITGLDFEFLPGNGRISYFVKPIFRISVLSLHSGLDNSLQHFYNTGITCGLRYRIQKA